ncbi:MAG: tetratricopeptide repeat protein [Candidatus Omnitrophica bacterium]|nr:tetratricopeptide repeat protein [Candidatus Omnitrophota bacterium]
MDRPLLNITMNIMNNKIVILTLIAAVIVSLWGSREVCAKSPMDFQVAPLASKISIYKGLAEIKNRLEESPDNIDLINQWAFIADYYGFWEETIKARTRLIEKGAGDFIVYVNLGREYMGLGEFDDAEKYLYQSLKIRPDNVFALYNLGLLYRYKGDFEQSLKFLKKASGIYPEWPEIYYELANTYLMTKQYDAAIENYTTSLELGLHDAALFENLGISYLGKKEKLKALESFEKALQTKSSDENLQKLFIAVKRSLPPDALSGAQDTSPE